MRAEAAARRHALAIAIAIALTSASACAPVKPVVGPRLSFPFWALSQPEPHRVGCAALVVWISKTGKRGLGVSLALTAPDGPCEVTLASAEVEVAGMVEATVAGPPPLRLAKGEVVRDYLPFFFDNERAWNHGRRTGRLLLSLSAGGARADLALPMSERNSPFFASRLAPDTSGLEVRPIYPDDAPGGAK